ncbi:hypothetical protein IKE82_01250 [Candidatus Saccharibacteria bacterium]|nr:hypothetical protein [Candidatus Saccharibacteria bacterium]
MHLIHVLVIVVAVLTVLSALALVFGSSKSEKSHSAWFLAAAIGEVIWGISIAVFLSLGNGPTEYTIAPWLVKGIYIGAIVMDVALLGYISWRYKTGKILTVIFAILGIALSAILCYDPSILYSTTTLSNGGNWITIDMSKGFYLAYALYFCAITPTFCTFLIYKIRHTANKKMKKGYWFFLIGLAVAGLLSLVFDIILPPSRYDLIWVGPLTIGLVIIGFYYAILKFRTLSLSTNWLRILTYIVLIGSAIIIYLLIFHLIFSALFKIANPSFQVILLNFIMIAILLLLMPAISELNSMTKSLILTKQIDLPYIVKKISASGRRKPDLKDLSGFLAEHMHFSYVGFLINGRLYGSEDYRVPAEDLMAIVNLKKPEHGIWQNLSHLGKNAARELEISRIGIITDAAGDEIGQIILGKPATKALLDKRDLMEIEMVISQVAIVVGNGSRKS